ncbi:type I 3-dehydroquinate dehydratase [Candidatus Peregrinibacteria bacterium]|nr:type I 3-dehydroquinate dehydratase [Candidatus Peregrinibacteria bacterium]
MFAVSLPSTAATDPIAFTSKAKAAGADLLEIRGDLTPDIPFFESPLPLIIAPRRAMCAQLQQLQPMFVDLELGEEASVPTGMRLIRSFHDYSGTPALQELRRIADRCTSEGAEIIKIATTINAYEDLRILDQFHAAVPKEQKRVILGMGSRSHLDRMLSPLRNELTYTYRDEDGESAPGQVPLSLYRKIAHCEQPRIFGILGGLDVRSGSPAIHNSLFQRHAIDALFTTFLSEDLEDAFRFIKREQVSGFAVSTPFKETIIDLLDAIDPLAAQLRSVNTVVLEHGKYKGYNTDADGLREACGFVTDTSSVAIIGSGGVVPSVLHACRERGARDITIFARNKKARENLAHRFSVRSHALHAIAEATPDVLICAVHDDASFPIPPAKRQAHALDLRYGAKTRFMTEAQVKGYRVHDGVSMLLHQALAQFRSFTGIAPPDSDFQMLLRLFPSSHGSQ